MRGSVKSTDAANRALANRRNSFPLIERGLGRIWLHQQELSQISQQHRFLTHAEPCRQTCPVMGWFDWTPRKPLSLPSKKRHCSTLSPRNQSSEDAWPTNEIQRELNGPLYF